MWVLIGASGLERHCSACDGCGVDGVLVMVLLGFDHGFIRKDKKVFESIGIVHGSAELLHNLDISEIDDIEFCLIDYEENGINSKRSEKTGVLTNDLVVERSGSGLDERLAIRELDGDGHGGEDIDSFESGLM
nr:hypothetical protein CFP56_44163 [Quercus suber]